jgi:hypothetical protein
LVVFAALIATSANAEPATTYRDNMGRVQGYATKKSGNTMTFSNAKGQEVGRAERRKDGTTIFYDASGQRTGTSKK